MLHLALADVFSAMGSFLVSHFVSDALNFLQAPAGARVHGSLEGTRLKQNFWVLARLFPAGVAAAVFVSTSRVCESQHPTSSFLCWASNLVLI